MMKEIALEKRGVNIEQAKLMEQAKKQENLLEYKKNNFIPKWVKRYSLIIGILYFLFGISLLYIMIKYKAKLKVSDFFIAKDVFALVLATTGTILIQIRNKKTQYIGTGIFVLFLSIQMFCHIFLLKN